MNRRGFLKRLGVTIGTTSVARVTHAVEDTKKVFTAPKLVETKSCTRCNSKDIGGPSYRSSGDSLTLTYWCRDCGHQLVEYEKVIVRP